MAFTARRFPELDPREILAMGTLGGAAALKSAHALGTLEPGRRPAILHLSEAAPSGENLIEKIVHGDTGTVTRIGE